MVVKILVVRHDIKVNMKDQDGRSPLSYAAEYGSEVVVKMLVSRDDVKVNTKDEAGHSLPSYAAEEGHEPVVKLLVMRDDVEQWTPRTTRPIHCYSMPLGRGMRQW